MNLPDQWKNPVRKLRNYAVARANFSSVSELARYMVSQGIRETSELYVPMFSGIVSTYAKNFRKATGMANLCNERCFTEFDNSYLQTAHNELMKAREFIYAHQDVPKAQAVPLGKEGPVKPFDVSVFVTEEGIIYKPCLIWNDDSTLHWAIRLCDKQVETLNAFIAENSEIVAGDWRETYRVGEQLELGASFPRQNQKG